jgi:hypothetical protein
MVKEEGEIVDELKEKLHLEIRLKQLRLKDLCTVMSTEKSREEREVKCKMSEFSCRSPQ